MLKLNVGLSRKIGEANYGSRGASVNLELEVESGLAGDPAALQDRIRSLYRLARAAVDEELGVAAHGTNGHGNGHGHSGQANGAHDRTNGSNRYGNGPNGNGTRNGSRRSDGRSATASQVRAIHAIANRQRLDLTRELQSRFGIDRPDDLSISQASELIDALKAQAGDNGGRR